LSPPFLLLGDSAFFAQGRGRFVYFSHCLVDLRLDVSPLFRFVSIFFFLGFLSFLHKLGLSSFSSEMLNALDVLSLSPGAPLFFKASPHITGVTPSCSIERSGLIPYPHHGIKI